MFTDTISGRLRLKKLVIIVASVVVLFYVLAPIYWVGVSSFQKSRR